MRRLCSSVGSFIGSTCAEFAQLLRQLLAYHPGKQLLIIHDRGAQHNGATVEAVVRAGNG